MFDRAVGAGLCALLALSAGCVVYYLEPSEAFAVSQRETDGGLYGTVYKANLLFTVDRSGSMEEPVDRSLPACLDGSGRVCGPGAAPCPASCPTRWSELRRAMGDFLSRSSELARMGLVLFPATDGGTTLEAQCAAPRLDAGMAVPVPIPQTADAPAELRASAAQIAAVLNASTPGGGTPTSQTLFQLAAYAPLTSADQRADVVVLLTDGLPNCNFSNPASGTDPGSGCQCISPPCSGVQARAGCLDDVETVRAVQALKAKNVSTIVVGFGASVDNPQGAEVLNRMAEAGGFPRRCAAANDCGAGDVCNGGTCGKKFYQANNAAELIGALDVIAGVLPKEPCTYFLDATPSDPDLISVQLEGRRIGPGADTWRYDTVEGRPALVFQGQLCARIKATPEAEAIPIVVRVLETY